MNPTAPTAGEQGSPPEPWMVKAAQELFPYGTSAYKSRDWERYAAIIARHAPARSQSGEGVPMWPGNYAADPTNWRFSVEEMNKANARIASLEAAEKDLLRMMNRTAEEAFGLDDTISLEPYDEYFIRQVAKLRAAARPADSGLVEAYRDYVAYLKRAEEMTIGFLYAHNWKYPTALINEGEELRARIAALSAQAPRPAAGEKSP